MATNLTYAPGEGNIQEATFSPSPIVFWLKVNMGVSSTRIVVRRPNTILGLIPLGYADNAYPLTNTASVGVSAKFSIGRLIFGLIFLIVGISLLVKNVGGIIFLLLGAALLIGVYNATLVVQNNGGGTNVVPVSIFEKSKLEQFRELINERLFADHAAMRHTQHMQVQNEQLMVQQQQLNAQIMQQNAQLQQQQPQQMQQPPMQQPQQMQQPPMQQPQQMQQQPPPNPGQGPEQIG